MRTDVDYEFQFLVKNTQFAVAFFAHGPIATTNAFVCGGEYVCVPASAPCVGKYNTYFEHGSYDSVAALDGNDDDD